MKNSQMAAVLITLVIVWVALVHVLSVKTERIAASPQIKPVPTPQIDVYNRYMLRNCLQELQTQRGGVVHVR